MALFAILMFYLFSEMLAREARQFKPECSHLTLIEHNHSLHYIKYLNNFHPLKEYVIAY